MATRPMHEMPDITEMRARYEQVAETPAAQTVSGLTFLSGLYLAISPWVVGFTHRGTLTVNNLITGIALGLLALAFASAYGRTHGVTWVTPLIGIWTVIALWVLPPHSASIAQIVNNALTGSVIIACGLAAAGITFASAWRGRRPLV